MNKFFYFLKKQPILITLLLLIIMLSVTVPSFFTYRNFINIAKQITINGIISLGLTFVVISGALDLSVGSLFSLFGIMMISLQSKNLLLAISAPFIAAIIFGFINGFLVSKFELNSIVATLGTLAIIGGLALVWSGGALLLGDPYSAYSNISNRIFFGVPIYVFIFLGIAIILLLVLEKSTFGRNLYLIGTNIEAAKIAGIKVNTVRITSFIICAVCVAVSALISTSRLASASPVAGKGFEFDAITAVLIGGNSLFGGKGGIPNTIIGVIFVGVIVNGLILFNMPFAFQSILRGLLLIIAIFVDSKTRG